LKFEVATLRPAAPGTVGGGIRPAPGGERYVAGNVSLRLMLWVAYQVKAEQVIGGPSWIDTDRFDMNGQAERPSTGDELHMMLRNLLEERFKLQFHHENREMPIYALTVDKSGPKLIEHQAQSANDPWIDVKIDQVVQTRWHAKFAPMDFFAWRLSLILDRPVVNQTNLKGGYDFDLSFTADLPPGIAPGAQFNGAAIDTSGPTIFAAIRQQLGLALERQKGPVDTIVIDRAEKLVDN
jgi:uncharacterized protein (TIGR03435 family)